MLWMGINDYSNLMCALVTLQARCLLYIVREKMSIAFLLRSHAFFVGLIGKGRLRTKPTLRV